MSKIKLGCLALGFFIAQTINAAAILSITPSASFLNVLSTEDAPAASMTWTVTNNSKVEIPNLSINPAYQTTAQASGITVSINNCTGSLAANGGTCTFTTSIQGQNQPSRFMLSPLVCAFQGEICSVPETNNRLLVRLMSRIPYVYIPTTARSTANLVAIAGDDFSVGTPANIGFNFYAGLAASADGSKLYTAYYEPNISGGALGVMAPGPTPDLFFYLPIPHALNLSGLAVSPDESKIYIGDYTKNLVYVIDHELSNDNYVLSASISGFNTPEDIIFTKDSQYAYVSNNGTTTISRINVANNTKTDITDPHCGFDAPFNFSLSPNGQKLYVSNINNNDISILDTSTNTCSTNIALPNALAITVSPDGRYVYAPSSERPDLSVIDTENNNTVTTYANVDGTAAGSVAVSADGLELFITSTGQSAVYVLPLENALPIANVAAEAISVGGQIDLILGDQFIGYLAN